MTVKDAIAMSEIIVKCVCVCVMTVIPLAIVNISPSRKNTSEDLSLEH